MYNNLTQIHQYKDRLMGFFIALLSQKDHNNSQIIMTMLSPIRACGLIH